MPFVHPLTVYLGLTQVPPWDSLLPDIHTPGAQAHVTLAPLKIETLKEGEETTLE